MTTLVLIPTLSLIALLFCAWGVVVLVERSLNSVDRLRQILMAGLMDLANVTLAFQMNDLAVEERRGKIEAAQEYAQLRLKQLALKTLPEGTETEK